MILLHSSILYFGALLLVLPTAENIPIQVPSEFNFESEETSRSISNIKEIEGKAKKAVFLGKLKEAFLLEELLENEIIKANLDLLVDGQLIRREANVRRKRAVDLLSAILTSNPDSTASVGSPTAAENARTIDGISSGLSLASSVLSSSSGKSNALVRKKRQDPSDNDILGTADGNGGDTEEPPTAEQNGITMSANISNQSGSGEGDLTFPGGGDHMSGGGGARDELVSTLTALSSPLSEFSMGGAAEGSGEEGEGGGIINPDTVLNLIGPLITSLSGGGGEDGGGLIGPDAGSLVNLAGSLSSSVIGGLSNEGSGGGGSDITGIVTGLAGQLSAGSSGGSGDGDGSNVVGILTGVAGSLSGSSKWGDGQNGTINGGSDIKSLVTGVVGPLSASSSGGNPDGPGGFNIGGAVAGAVAGLAGSLSASISGGGDSDTNGDGGGSGGSGSLITSLLGGSSGGGGGISGSSDSSYDDDNQVDTAGGGSDLFGLLGSLSGAIGGSEGSNGEEGGSSGSGLISLLANIIASTSAGTGDGASGGGGGGSGSFIASILGASSGGSGDGAGGYSNGGGGDLKTQIFSLLFRLKLAVFQSLLSLVTGASASSSGGKF